MLLLLLFLLLVVYWHSSLYFLVQSQTDVLDILNSAAISA